MKTQHDSKYDKTAVGIFLKYFYNLSDFGAIEKVGLAKEGHFSMHIL